ncbi:hypothetical protein FBU30_002208, partial [Linnemannia zychae]
FQCLDLNLWNGLSQLEKSKELQILGCARMATDVWADEIEWMMVNWPKVQVLVEFERNEEVI